MTKADTEAYASTSRRMDPWNALSSTIMEANEQPIECYHHAKNDFERCPEMVAAVLGTKRGANLFVNFFSEQRESFRRSRLHQMFDEGGRTMTIAVEVESTKRPISIEEMGSLVDLRRDIAVDRFCVVSTSGFTEAARTKAKENDIELATMSELERNEFRSPTTTVRRTGGELRMVRFDFAEDVLREHAQALREALDGTASRRHHAYRRNRDDNVDAIFERNASTARSGIPRILRTLPRASDDRCVCQCNSS